MKSTFEILSKSVGSIFLLLIARAPPAHLHTLFVFEPLLNASVIVKLDFLACVAHSQHLIFASIIYAKIL